MHRLTLHLVGSVLLGLALTVFAVCSSQSTARASQPAPAATVETASPAAPTQGLSLLARCQRLMRLPNFPTALDRDEVLKINSTSFGWNYLPAKLLPY